ncbi:MAG: hypothetical protein KKA73_18385 [Chloroflexi bacterium]|nr:hypothetical protein [Chloroflexota bacterium]MBU1749656.1 hypothetical protein [Chloroflexota bacterium]
MNKVRICGHGYAVALADGWHWVGKDAACVCERGPDCPAVDAVRQFRHKGGAQAPAAPVNVIPGPPPEFDTLVAQLPVVCPICGGPVKLNFAANGRGPGDPRAWLCQTDAAHWWEWRVQQVFLPQPPRPALVPTTCSTCHGSRFLRCDVVPGHPDFGKMIPCSRCQPMTTMTLWDAPRPQETADVEYV